MEKKTDFKALPTKSKFQYIWDYYRWHIIGTILVVGIITSLVYHYVTYQEPALNIIMINSNHYEYTDMTPFDAYLEYAGIDPSESCVSFASTPYFGENAASSDTYTDYEVMGVQIATGSVDIFIGNGDIYTSYTDQGALLDLSTVLSTDVLERYTDHLLYTTNGGKSEAYPCAIEFTDDNWLTKQDYYSTPCYVGIFANCPNRENAVKFLQFLIEKN